MQWVRYSAIEIESNRGHKPQSRFEVGLAQKIVEIKQAKLVCLELLKIEWARIVTQPMFRDIISLDLIIDLYKSAIG
jgi:hypothetical protein